MYSRKPARTKTKGAQVLNTMRATGCEEVGVVDSGVGVVQAIDTLANSLSLARSSQPHPSLRVHTQPPHPNSPAPSLSIPQYLNTSIQHLLDLSVSV